MVEDLSRFGGAAGLPPHQWGSRIKIAIIIALAIAILVVGGGGFYYFQLYRPQQYARSVIGLYEGAMDEWAKALPPAPPGGIDFEAASAAIQTRTALAEHMKGALVSLDVPPAMESVNETFSRFIETNLAALVDAEAKAEFFNAATELKVEIDKVKKVLQTDAGPVPAGSPPKPITPPKAGEVRAVWEEGIPRIQSLGDALFAKDPGGLADPSFFDLNAAWQKPRPGLALLLGVIRKVNPEARLDTIPRYVPEGELRRAGETFNALGEFLNLLDTALAKGSPDDILAFRSFPRQAELSERNFQLLQTIEGLRRDYGP
jgi:hypothetical protein